SPCRRTPCHDCQYRCAQVQSGPLLRQYAHMTTPWCSMSRFRPPQMHLSARTPSGWSLCLVCPSVSPRDLKLSQSSVSFYLAILRPFAIPTECTQLMSDGVSEMTTAQQRTAKQLRPAV